MTIPRHMPSSQPVEQSDLAREVAAALAGAQMSIVETLVDEAKPAAWSRVNRAYETGSAMAYRESKLGPEAKVWSHQAAALDYLAHGDHVITATPTASGKSLIFQLHALKIVDEGGTIIVLYPLKALAADQKLSWQKAMAAAGLSPDTVAEITGDTERSQRIAMLEKAKILLMTPDVMHAWFMSSTGNPSVRSYLARLRLLVIDEAHVFDSVLGSSSAYLFRRLFVVATLVQTTVGAAKPGFQIAASSATIPDPAKHMEDLTGLPFKCIGDLEDGSPRHRRTIFHVAAPQNNPTEALGSIMKILMKTSPSPLILFCDSRVMVERMSRVMNSDRVLPYRQGYELSDRKAIEDNLRSGKLSAVVSTSALEMGIDIPLLQVGVNMDALAPRRSIRQRIGRVGRAGESVFIILAASTQFKTFGETFADYIRGPVEKTSLYTENRFIQYQHARCLAYEAVNANLSIDDCLKVAINWPRGFDAFMHRMRDPTLHQEFDDLQGMVVRARGVPHYAFGIRSIGDDSYEIRTEDGKRLGTINHSAAMKEAYPGGTYTHLKANFRVQKWTRHPAPTIIVEPAVSAYTTALQKTSVNAQIDCAGILNGRFIGTRQNFLAECAIVVKLKTFGYKMKEIETIYPPDVAVSRTISTSGVVMVMPQLPTPEWRQALGEELLTRFRRSKNVAHGDVDLTVSPIGLRDRGTLQVVTNAITIYDSLRGSLRLTEALYESMPLLVRQIVRHGSVMGRKLPADMISTFEDWWRSLDDDPAPPLAPASPQPFMVLPPRAQINLTNRPDEIHFVVEPLLVVEGSKRELHYVCRGENGQHDTIAEWLIRPGHQGLIPWTPDGIKPAGRISRVDYEL